MIKELILGLILGFLIMFFSHNLVNSITDGSIQSNIIITLILGIVCICIGYFLLWDSDTIRNGLLIGGFLLLYNSLIMNWGNIDNVSRTVILGGILVWLSHYLYNME